MRICGLIFNSDADGAWWCGEFFRKVFSPYHRGKQSKNEMLGIQKTYSEQKKVELTGLEPVTPTLPVWCATSCAIAPD